MPQPVISINSIPDLADLSAAFGALTSTIQIGGSTLFDIVVATVPSIIADRRGADQP